MKGKIKWWVNTQTGEVISSRSRLKVLRYFKADGKLYGYKVGYKDVITLEQWRKRRLNG